jgi:hypothetical protein
MRVLRFPGLHLRTDVLAANRWSPARADGRVAPADADGGRGVLDGWLGRVCGCAGPNPVAPRRAQGGEPRGDWRGHPLVLGHGPEDRLPRSASPTVATEFVGTSVTSLGVPYESFAAVLPDNPHVRVFESRLRGYVRCEVTSDRWTTDLRVLDGVRDPRARAAAPRGRRRRSATSGQAVRAMELTGRPLTPNYRAGNGSPSAPTPPSPSLLRYWPGGRPNSRLKARLNAASDW